MSVEVSDNRGRGQYEIWTGGEVAGLARYRLHAERITFRHTEIDAQHRGAGLGSRVVRAALDDARERRLTVLPVCPFMVDFIRRHPDEYLDVAAAPMQRRVSADA